MGGRAKEDVHSTGEAFLCFGQEGGEGLSKWECYGLVFVGCFGQAIVPQVVYESLHCVVFCVVCLEDLGDVLDFGT